MVYFKCKVSGTVVGFEWEYDIEQMRKHKEYEEVKQEDKKVESKKVTKNTKED
jgi:hypothetical protein